MNLKKYASIMRGGFCEGYAFRKQLFSSLLANFIQLLALFFVWRSIFQHQDAVGGYTWCTMQQYIFVAYLCNSTFSFEFETEMSKKIIKGDIIIDLLKPVSYKSMMFCRMLGSAVIEFMTTLAITGSLFLVLNGIPYISLFRVGMFFFTLLCGMVIKFEIQFMVSSLCFYTDNSYGIVKGREVISNILSGAVLPLGMFPSMFRSIVSILPFPYMVYFPCQVFIGGLSAETIAKQIVIQIVWISVLHFASSFAWKRASRKVTLYGG